jgi:hypothetical protein
MATKRRRSPKVSCIQHIDTNSLTVQGNDDHFEEKQVVPVENVHQPVENVLTGFLDDDLTGDCIDLTDDFIDLTDDGVITGEKKENEYIGEQEKKNEYIGEKEKENEFIGEKEKENENATAAVKKKKKRPPCESCACGCGEYSRACGGQQTRNAGCLKREHGELCWASKFSEEKQMLRAPGNLEAHKAQLQAATSQLKSWRDSRTTESRSKDYSSCTKGEGRSEHWP